MCHLLFNIFLSRPLQPLSPFPHLSISSPQLSSTSFLSASFVLLNISPFNSCHLLFNIFLSRSPPYLDPLPLHAPFVCSPHSSQYIYLARSWDDKFRRYYLRISSPFPLFALSFTSSHKPSLSPRLLSPSWVNFCRFLLLFFSFTSSSFILFNPLSLYFISRLHNSYFTTCFLLLCIYLCRIQDSYFFFITVLFTRIDVFLSLLAKLR